MNEWSYPVLSKARLISEILDGRDSLRIVKIRLARPRRGRDPPIAAVAPIARAVLDDTAEPLSASARQTTLRSRFAASLPASDTPTS
jgi:hypothetical protein